MRGNHLNNNFADRFAEIRAETDIIPDVVHSSGQSVQGKRNIGIFKWEFFQAGELEKILKKSDHNHSLPCLIICSATKS